MEKRKRNSRTAAERVGENIRALRTDAGLTLAALSGMLSEVGYPMSINTLSKVERAARVVDPDDLEMLAAVLGVQVADLLDDRGGAPRSTVASIRATAARYEQTVQAMRSSAVDVRGAHGILQRLAQALRDDLAALPEDSPLAAAVGSLLDEDLDPPLESAAALDRWAAHLTASPAFDVIRQGL